MPHDKNQTASLRARGVDIRPLFKAKDTEIMFKEVNRLLYSIGVKYTDICQITFSKFEGIASVLVRTMECENFMIAMFKDPAIIMNRYDLRRITKDPRKLVVSRLSMQGQGSSPFSANFEVELQENATLKLLLQATGSHEDETDTVELKQKENVPLNLKDKSTKVNQTADSYSSPTFSQYSFEKLPSEREMAAEFQRTCDVATSTTDATQFKKKSHHDKVGRRQLGESKLSLMDHDGGKKGVTAKPAIHANPAPSSTPTSNTAKNTESVESPNETIRSADTKSTKPRHSTPGPSLPRSSESQITPPIDSSAQEVIKLHAKTSTPSMLPCGCPETVFYHMHQHIGAETRHAEFKRGGIWRDQRMFRLMVGKYVCGFLNSEGGTIFFGVTDDGRVRGIQMDAQLEDDLRSDVDFAVENMLDPRVDPSEYSVNFARVMEDNGQLSGDLRVMEVCVKPRRPSRDIRYSCANVVYLRRDGSLQAISRGDRADR